MEIWVDKKMDGLISIIDRQMHIYMHRQTDRHREMIDVKFKLHSNLV